MPPQTRYAARLMKAIQYRPIVITTDHAATATVFNNVELLEMIIQNLSHLTLTRIELVHPVWKENIRTSPKLLEQRFLKAKTDGEALGTTVALRQIPRVDVGNFCIFRDVVPDGFIYHSTISDVHPALTSIQHDCLVFVIRAEKILSWKDPAPWQDQFIMQPPYALDQPLYFLGKEMQLSHLPHMFRRQYFTIPRKLFHQRQGLVNHDHYPPFASPKTGVSTLGDLRKWAEEITAGESKACIREIKLYFAACNWIEERNIAVVFGRKVNRGEIIMGTPEGDAALVKHNQLFLDSASRILAAE